MASAEETFCVWRHFQINTGLCVVPFDEINHLTLPAPSPQPSTPTYAHWLSGLGRGKNTASNPRRRLISPVLSHTGYIHIIWFCTCNSRVSIWEDSKLAVNETCCCVLRSKWVWTRQVGPKSLQRYVQYWIWGQWFDTFLRSEWTPTPLGTKTTVLGP